VGGGWEVGWMVEGEWVSRGQRDLRGGWDGSWVVIIWNFEKFGIW
jgi:hypothetical protein